MNEIEYQQVVNEVCQRFFDLHKFELKFDDLSKNNLPEEDSLDFKWRKFEDQTVLNLNKPSPKTHQYRLYFSNLDIKQTESMNDSVSVLKLLINMLAWMKSLKCKSPLLIYTAMNYMMVSEEVVPLRQDCKTLTVVNNIRSILDDATNLDSIDGDIDMLATDARNLQEYLQDV